MLELQDLTHQYLQNCFHPAQTSSLLRALQTLSRFGLSEYETPLLDIIYVHEEMDAGQSQSMFFECVHRQLLQVCEEHGVQIRVEMEPTLEETTQITQALLTVQDLEDTHQLSYRVYALDTPRRIWVDVVSMFSTLSVARASELVQEVHERLVVAMQQLCAEREQAAESGTIHHAHWSSWQSFCQYIGEQTHLGQRASTQGWFGVPAQELLQLLSEDQLRQLSTLHVHAPAQLALNWLSLLMLAPDTYQTPLLCFDQLAPGWIESPTQLGAARLIVSQMWSDYQDYLQAQHQLQSTANTHEH